MRIVIIIIVLITLVSLYYGGICLVKPDFGIKIFQAWCRFINWRVEPIDYKGEVFRTRIFGLTLLVLIIVFLIVGRRFLFGE